MVRSNLRLFRFRSTSQRGNDERLSGPRKRRSRRLRSLGMVLIDRRPRSLRDEIPERDTTQPQAAFAMSPLLTFCAGSTLSLLAPPPSMLIVFCGGTHVDVEQFSILRFTFAPSASRILDARSRVM